MDIKKQYKTMETYTIKIEKCNKSKFYTTIVNQNKILFSDIDKIKTEYHSPIHIHIVDEYNHIILTTKGDISDINTFTDKTIKNIIHFINNQVINISSEIPISTELVKHFLTNNQDEEQYLTDELLELIRTNLPENYANQLISVVNNAKKLEKQLFEVYTQQYNLKIEIENPNSILNKVITIINELTDENRKLKQSKS